MANITYNTDGTVTFAQGISGEQTDDFINAGFSTGVISGGVLTLGSGAPDATFSITDGSGLVVDNTTDAANPTLVKVEWTGKTDITVTNIGTHLITFVSINSSGTVVQRTSRWTAPNYRDEIVLGVVVHVDMVKVDVNNQEQAIAINSGAQISDILAGLSFMNISGNVVSAAGTNLTINKTAGVMMHQGANWANDDQNPHQLSLPALTPITFQYRFQDGSNGVTGTSIDPDIYDNGGTSTAVPAGKHTIQRIYSFTSNNIKILPGQTIYNKQKDALAAIQTESFVVEPSVAANGLLRGFLVIKEATTNLSVSGSAFFLAAGKFGEVAGAGGLSVSTLQAAYDNSTVLPEVETSDSGGALNIRRGTTGGDTDDVFTVQNNAGTDTTTIDGTGIVSAKRLEVDQTTADSGLINFKGTIDADATSAISSLTTSGSVTHHIQVEINGTTFWVPGSTTDPT